MGVETTCGDIHSEPVVLNITYPGGSFSRPLTCITCTQILDAFDQTKTFAF